MPLAGFALYTYYNMPQIICLAICWIVSITVFQISSLSPKVSCLHFEAAPQHSVDSHQLWCSGTWT